jgi:hypothetical protein
LQNAGVTRALAAVAVVLSAAAVVLAVAVLQRAGDQPRLGVLSDASLRRLSAQVPNRLTRADVKALIGAPDSIYRNNPRAECWAYEAPGGGSGRERPYEVQMCFGPRRHLAWLGHSGPRRLA